jgi:polyisoprenoid-binding protein YceI
MKQPKKIWKWIVGAVLLAALALTAGPFIYIHFIKADAPSELALSDPGTSTGTAVPIDGTWQPTSESVFGYRVKEILVGQSTEAAGRTNKVTGEIKLAGTSLVSGQLSVDMTSVTSDESRRDGQFQGRIMDTSSFPTATLKINKPVDFGSVPTNLTKITVNVTADLTLRGTTKTITVPVTARRNGAKIEVNGTIPIVFADWNIPNPTNSLAKTEDHGVLEFLVVFAKV